MKGVLFVVGRGGFEPPKSKTSDLQSDPFGHSGICPYYKIVFPKLGAVSCLRQERRRADRLTEEIRLRLRTLLG